MKDKIKEKLFDLEHECWNSRNYSNMFAFTSQDIDEVIEETKKAERERFNNLLNKHRKESFLSCSENCFCWDIEEELTQEEKDGAIELGEVSPKNSKAKK